MNQECTSTQGRPAQILLVEDDLAHARLMVNRLKKLGTEPHHVTTRAAALESLTDRRFDLLLLDMGLPDGSGFQIQEWLRSWPVAPPVVFVTADDLAEHAVQAIQGGAKHYVIKRPNYLNQIAETVDSLLKQAGAGSEAAKGQALANVVVGQSPSIVGVRRALQEFAAAEGPVLVTGEVGVGKSLVSRTLHTMDGAESRPLTVADSREIGLQSASESVFPLLESASGGTLVVEGIEEATEDAQLELLQLVEKVSGSHGWRTGTRLILESRSDLGHAVSNGMFSRALWSRIRAVKIDIPPLRARLEDVRVIATHELKRIAAESHAAPFQVEADAWDALDHHAWPGNVTELLFVIRRAASSASDRRVLDGFMAEEALHYAKSEFTSRARFERQERDRLRSALDANGWNVSKTARSLSVTRGWLRRKMQTLDLHE